MTDQTKSQITQYLSSIPELSLIIHQWYQEGRLQESLKTNEADQLAIELIRKLDLRVADLED